MVNTPDIIYFLSTLLWEILFLKSAFQKMTDNPVTILAFTDNECLYRSGNSTGMTNGQRLQIDIALIKQMISQNELRSIKWIPGTE